MQVGPACIRNPNLGIARARRREGYLGSVARPCRRLIAASRRARRKVHYPEQFQRVHADGPTLAAQGCEGDARIVRRDARRERDGAQVRDLILVLPVVVHYPNLFASAARADKIYLCLGDAVDPATQPQDDLVGKPVRYGPRHIRAGHFVVLLAQHLGIGGVAGVIQPAGDSQPAIGCRERAEGHHGCVGRRRRPLR